MVIFLPPFILFISYYQKKLLISLSIMRKASLYLIAMMVLLLLAAGCASIGNPSGGPRDEDPPRFLSATPQYGETEVTPKKIVLTFDELVTVKDPFSKVVVSPPGSQAPRVSSLGRRVTVEFRDTLKDSTTYTINFGDAIADNNEGNKLENFMYTFSTGLVLDSLMVSGMVLDAQNLAPAAGIYVGLHSNPEDSAFTKTRFERIAKTDENGKFVIGGLAPGQYRIYALDDRDNNLMWSSPEESLAFYDAIIEPKAEFTTATDTIFDLFTGNVDSLITRQRTRFVPNNILLRSFNTGFKQQYITKYERLDSTRLNFIFNAPADSLPKIDVILTDGSIFPIDMVAITERSATNDTLTFWLKDQNIISRDTLKVAVEYLRADSTYTLRPVNDTIRMLAQKPNPKAKKEEKKSKVGKGEAENDSIPAPVPTVAIKPLTGKPEINQKVYLEFPTPLESFDPGMVHLRIKQDSTYLDVKDFRENMLVFDTLNSRRLAIDYPWAYETSYQLTVDSLAGKDIYGIFTDDLKLEFSTRPESEYGTLKFNITNYGGNDVARFVQLLDAQGRPIRTAPFTGGSVKFDFLLPAKYHVRIVEDRNGNGQWDPGNLETGLQPDVSYYFKETVDLKANWDQETDWNVFGTPVDKMLPEPLRKNTNKRN